MNADNIRELYEYHFALNRRVWDEGIMTLSEEQFLQEFDYSLGSVRNHVVHMLSVDERWFARLRQVEVPPRLDGGEFPDRASVRARWDGVEGTMRNYLAGLDDAQAAATLTYATSRRGETRSEAWRILVHVVNHGTDHRAQLLSLLYQLGAPTLEQDMMIHWWALKDAAE